MESDEWHAWDQVSPRSELMRDTIGLHHPTSPQQPGHRLHSSTSSAKQIAGCSARRRCARPRCGCTCGQAPARALLGRRQRHCRQQADAGTRGVIRRRAHNESSSFAATNRVPESREMSLACRPCTLRDAGLVEVMPVGQPMSTLSVVIEELCSGGGRRDLRAAVNRSRFAIASGVIYFVRGMPPGRGRARKSLSFVY